MIGRKLSGQSLGLLVVFIVFLLAMACSTGSKAPVQNAPTAPTATPAPTTPTPSPTPTTSPTPSPTPATSANEGQPLVPGGPPYFPAKLAQTTFVQQLDKYNMKKLPLWSKAIYGGRERFTINWNPTQTLDYLNVGASQVFGGGLLLIDVGICKMEGREGKFDTCPAGNYGPTLLSLSCPASSKLGNKQILSLTCFAFAKEFCGQLCRR